MIALWFAILLVSTIVGSTKGRSTMGFFLGLCLGPLGLLAICFMSSHKTKKLAFDMPPGRYDCVAHVGVDTVVFQIEGGPFVRHKFK